MSESLIKEMAITWIEGGGDADGITYCWRAIRDAVTEIEREEPTNENRGDMR